MIAFSPDYDTIVLLVISLASEACVHHVNAANSAGVTFDVPRPHRDGIPFLECEGLASRLLAIEGFYITAAIGVLTCDIEWRRRLGKRFATVALQREVGVLFDEHFFLVSHSKRKQRRQIHC